MVTDRAPKLSLGILKQDNSVFALIANQITVLYRSLDQQFYHLLGYNLLFDDGFSTTRGRLRERF
jgi:hypothetical protein